MEQVARRGVLVLERYHEPTYGRLRQGDVFFSARTAKRFMASPPRRLTFRAAGCVMALDTGSRLGPFVIVFKIGAGRRRDLPPDIVSVFDVGQHDAFAYVALDDDVIVVAAGSVTLRSVAPFTAATAVPVSLTPRPELNVPPKVPVSVTVPEQRIEIGHPIHAAPPLF